jgi:transmembrane sensor
MLELERLIKKFWNNQTTLEDNRRLIQLLQQYNKTYKDIAQYDFHEKEEGSAHSLQPGRALSLLQNIHKNLGLEGPKEMQKAKTASVRQLFRRMAVAAVICLIAVAAWLLKDRHPSSTPSTQTAVSTASRLIRMINGSDSTMVVYLKDGSTVALGKNSSLSYYEPFINDRRDLSLFGLALFKVAKDKTKPFTVYAGGIVTRVLGTRFLVNATDTAKVRVRLLEGKVVVNTTKGSGRTMNDVYLAPGQELSFDKGTGQYAVNSLTDKPAASRKTVLPDNRPELVFRKEPLGLVFKRVGDLYEIPLSIRKEELNGLYFTGTFLKSDNLNLVLTTICNVNDLLFTKEQDSIIITKKH